MSYDKVQLTPDLIFVARMNDVEYLDDLGNFQLDVVSAGILPQPWDAPEEYFYALEKGKEYYVIDGKKIPVEPRVNSFGQLILDNFQSLTEAKAEREASAPPPPPEELPPDVAASIERLRNTPIEDNSKHLAWRIGEIEFLLAIHPAPPLPPP